MLETCLNVLSCVRKRLIPDYNESDAAALPSVSLPLSSPLPSQTMASTSWSFIIEIVLGIIEQSYFNSGTEPNYAALRVWSLVSKTISFDSQRLLFRDVRLGTFSSTAAFLQATNPSSERGRQLSSHVCRLRVPFAGGITEERMAAIVRRCTNLYELQVVYSGYELQDFEPDTVAALALVAPSVRALDVSILNEPFVMNGTTDALMLQLVRHLPNVEFLALHNRVSLSRSPFTRPPPALYELTWDTFDPPLDNQASRLREHLDWLLQPSANSLRVLRFGPRGLVQPAVFGPLAVKYGKQVTSLTIESRVDKHARNLHLFPALHELVLGWVDHASIMAVHHAWVASSAKIRHLAIRGITGRSIVGLIKIVEDSTELVCITYFMSDVSMRQLRDVCNLKGVRLQTCDPFPPRTMPLRAPDYPRTVHPDDFKAMQPRY